MSQGPVLVLTHESDYAADSVIRYLNAAGVEVVRWNAETLHTSIRRWQPHAPRDRYRSVWLRDFLPPMPTTDDVAELDEQLVVRAQWRAWASTLEEASQRWINPLWEARRAENKIVQLSVASRLGLNLPATIVTNDASEARTFAAACPHGAVVKTIASSYFRHSDDAFMYTTRVDENVLADSARWQAQPLIVQRRIPRSRDIRLVLAGDHVAAASCVTDGEDWRTGPRPEWVPMELQPVVIGHCRALVGKHSGGEH